MPEGLRRFSYKGVLTFEGVGALFKEPSNQTKPN